MKRFFTYLPPFVFLLLSLSCSRGPRMISEKDMSRIYMDMLLLDQWITINSDKKTADTSLVYEPVFRKYGYTTEDFTYSVDRYQEDPDKFAAILENTASYLEEHLEYMDAAMRSKQHRDSLDRVRNSFLKRRYTPNLNLFDKPYDRDTLRFDLDTANRMWKLVTISRFRDTTYKGPEIIVSSRARRAASSSQRHIPASSAGRTDARGTAPQRREASPN